MREDKFLYEVPEKKKVRVIVDTDAACEADDPFAIAHALMSRKFEVKAILAEHFGQKGTVQKSYSEIMTVLDAMEIKVPVFMGEDVKIAERDEKQAISPASQFLVEEAMREDEKPLYILCMGALTNVAVAICACPQITKQMTVVWIGGRIPDERLGAFREFNAGNDVEAANIAIRSGVNFWQIPQNVYCTMQIGLSEIQRRVYPCGKIGKHLFENMVQYNHSEYAGWTDGESWSLGDSPAVGVVLSQHCGDYIMHKAPLFSEDTSHIYPDDSPEIRIYTSIDSRFILEDFMCKLEILYSIE